MTLRHASYFAIMALLLVIVGVMQSPAVALTILNLCIISAIMALGVNLQWGYAGLLNVGIMGFTAIGGLGAVLVAMPPVRDAWSAGGIGVILSAIVMLGFILAAILIRPRLTRYRGAVTAIIIIAGYFTARLVFDPATAAIEAVNPSRTGYLGGLGLPILLGWPVGGLLAAGAAWLVGKTALGLRSDYLAIATLGISEIIIAILKNEDWLSRGVKNVTSLPRTVPTEVGLREAPWFINLCETLGTTPSAFAGLFVDLCYTALFGLVLIIFTILAQRALHSPWGRMMRAIRDNETAARAMGKDVTRRHLEIFVLGSAVVGVAGAMLVTMNGQFTPTSYVPLRYTFLILVMVIVGGSGNNFGAILGGFVIWFVWVEAEPVGRWLMDVLTGPLGEDSALRDTLVDRAAHMRMIFMGAILLLVMRFAPRGLIPEERGRRH
ncbi:branched-chain amino acid ABC transporter permease [Paracoccaceae bacterium GXU_MW_L88]